MPPTQALRKDATVHNTSGSRKNNQKRKTYEEMKDNHPMLGTVEEAEETRMGNLPTNLP